MLPYYFFTGFIPLLVLEGRFLFGNIHGSHNVAKFRHALGVTSFIVTVRISKNKKETKGGFVKASTKKGGVSLQNHRH